MTSTVFRSVLKPAKLLYVATGLLYIEVGAAFALTVLTGEPLATFVFMVVFHVWSIGKTNKEPHINNILRNKYRQFCEQVGLKSSGMVHFCKSGKKYRYEL